MTARPLYLDCDTGIDDALALAWLLASPAIDLVGIGSVSGNIDSTQAARNTLDVLGLADRAQPPVAIGARASINGDVHHGAAAVHGNNGIGGVQLPRSAAEPIDGDAADLLIELARSHPGELDVLAIGPFTNLALALQREPELPRLVRRVVVMGGSVLVPGNVAAVAEANVWHDAEAAQIAATAGWDFTLVPLDVTMEHRFGDDDLARLTAAGHPLTTALAQMLDSYLDFYVGVFGYRTCALHDPLAAAIISGEVEPKDAPYVPLVVDDTAGPGRGQTIADLRRRRIDFAGQQHANAHVVLGLAEPFGPVLLERLLSYADR